jgi:hypothetical protein
MYPGCVTAAGEPATVGGTLEREANSMAFKNEKISAQDLEWVSKPVNYESIRAISEWVPWFSTPLWWTADRERNAFLLRLGGGGNPNDIGSMAYRALILDGQVIVFNVVEARKGNHADGMELTVGVHSLIVPPVLELRREEIKRLLREALEESAYCRPTADGGTGANPNMVARWNITYFNVEFK